MSSSDRKSPSAGFAFLPDAPTRPVGVDRRLVQNRQKRRIERRMSPAPSSRARRAPTGSNAGRSRPSKSPASAAARARPSTSTARRTAGDRRRVQLVVNHHRRVKAVLAVRLGRDRPVDAPARSVDDPLLRFDDVARRVERRIVPDHLRRDPEHQTRPGPGRPPPNTPRRPSRHPPAAHRAPSPPPAPSCRSSAAASAGTSGTAAARPAAS